MALKTNEGVNVVEKVVVAVKASKDISKTALVWALTHVAHPGDCITFLIVLPDQTSGRKIWGFPRFAGDCANGHKKFHSGASLDLKSDIADYCSRMMIQLHDMYDPHKVNVKIKIVSGSPCGEVAIESKRIQANWVVLDRQLKHEQKRCMEELQSNIVVMKHSRPKVLRLNLAASPQEETQSDFSKKETTNLERGPNVTPTSSPEVGTIFTGTETGTASISSSDPGTSPMFAMEKDYEVKKEDNFLESKLGVRNIDFLTNVGLSNNKTTLGKALMEKFCKLDIEAGTLMLNHRQVMDFNANVHRAPPGPPPLCSVCQYKAPVFGKPPRSFSYAELKHYTDGFSQANFLAEGGFGSVYKGILPDGQAVAVKQHKLASSQGDLEFCSEVEVLSCAQHRNVVTLIGFCVEDRRRLLVYEYICNGSLDSYLYGQNCQPLEWEARQRIAIGAARGLRYLHEECRVGCIVHRDMRPSNILLTHDFEPLVGDFGLARWQPNGNLGVDTRVIGTFGYLAPEYTQSGQITEKADVYSFGVVLVELVTGRRAVDINRPRGQQFLTEWARPLLERTAVEQLVDPRLENRYSESDVHCMLRAASLCIHRDPHVRPRMSQVIRILEGDMIAESPNFSSTPACEGWWRQWVQRAEDEQQSGHHSNGEIMHMPSKIYYGRLS